MDWENYFILVYNTNSGESKEFVGAVWEEVVENAAKWILQDKPSGIATPQQLTDYLDLISICDAPMREDGTLASTRALTPYSVASKCLQLIG